MADKTPLKYEGSQHRPFDSGDTVSPGLVALNSRVIAGDGFTIVDLGGGRLRIDNDCCTNPPSVHNAFLTVSPGSGAEGSTFTFTVTLGTPVAIAPLVVQIDFSGTEQAAHNYPTPVNVLIPIGAMQGSYPVNTINDNTGGPNTTLTGTIVPNVRLSNTGSPASATVVAQDTAVVGFTLPTGGTFCCAGQDLDSSQAITSVVFNLDGTMALRSTSPGTCDNGGAGTWVTGTFVPGNYEVRFNASVYAATGVTTTYGAAAGVWQPLGAAVSYSAEGSAATATNSTSTLQGVFEVRRVSDGLVLATSAPVNLRAFSGPTVTSADCTPLPSMPSTVGGACYVDDPSTAGSYFALQFLPDGTFNTKQPGGGWIPASWLPAGANPSDYEMRVVFTFAGANASYGGPASGSWVNLGTTRTMTWTVSGPGIHSANLDGTLETRRVGSSTPETTTTIITTFISVNVDCP